MGEPAVRVGWREALGKCISQLDITSERIAHLLSLDLCLEGQEQPTVFHQEDRKEEKSIETAAMSHLKVLYYVKTTLPMFPNNNMCL